MPTLTNFLDKKVLVVEDASKGFQQLRVILNTIGFKTLNFVSSAEEALAKTEVTRYDLIICDYDLSGDTNGQQLLEYLRTKKGHFQHTIFCMMTAENSYEKIICAAECMPDEYFLRPFTYPQFSSRLNLMLERQTAFEKIHQLYDQKKWSMVVQECERSIANKSKFHMKLSKVKAEALLNAEQPQLAMIEYEQLLKHRDVPWAKLALAKVKAKLGFYDEARSIIDMLIVEKPQYIESYDFSSDLLMQKNLTDDAMQVVKKAMQKNPTNRSRVRSYTGLAMSQRDYADAEAAARASIEANKYSLVKDASDYGVLSRALIEQGGAYAALELLDDAADYFQDEANKVLLAASNSVAWLRSGNKVKAEQDLNKALASDVRILPSNVVTTIADACYVAGKDDVATNLLKQVLQNNVGDLKLQSQVKLSQVIAGKPLEGSDALIERSEQELITLNNEAVAKARSGQFDEAITLVVGAAEQLPNNLSVVSNAAMITSAALTTAAFTQTMLDQCARCRQNLYDLSPQHPNLSVIDAKLAKLKLPA